MYSKTAAVQQKRSVLNLSVQLYKDLDGANLCGGNEFKTRH
jgi:hypothetical protein